MGNEMISNSKRIPLLFCVDTSDSMRCIFETSNIKKLDKYDIVEGERVMLAEGGTTYLEDVKKKLSTFIAEMNKNVKVKYSTEVSLLTFGSDIKQDIPFTSLKNFELKEKLNDPSGTSKFCSAFLHSLTLISGRYSYYRNRGILHYPARIVIFTDGKITDAHKLDEIKRRISENFTKTNLFVYIVSLAGDDINLINIQKATDATVFHFDQSSITSFFNFLGKSISTKPNEKGQQPPKDVFRLQGRIR